MAPITPFQQNQADDMPKGKSPKVTGSTNFGKQSKRPMAKTRFATPKSPRGK